MSKERKIHYHTLYKWIWRTDGDTKPYVEIINVFKYLKSLPKKSKLMDLKDDKSCFLSAVNIKTDKAGIGIISGLFSSARHSHSPNLINVRTGEERPSPKSLQEGDKEKTHFAFNITAEEVFMVLEGNLYGVGINQILGYLTKYQKVLLTQEKLKMNFSIKAAKISKGDFLNELNKLKRTVKTVIHFDKALLGSAGLNFSNRTVNLKKI